MTTTTFEPEIDTEQETEPEPVPNLPLLRKAMEQIQVPGAWDQTSWMHTDQASECGTAGCVAGWAVTLTDKYELMYQRRDEHDPALSAEMYVEYVKDRDTGEEEFLETAAQRELGLTDDEAELLFMGNNSFRELNRQVKEIAARAGEKW